MATGWGEKNFEFKPVKLPLKIDIVSLPAHTERERERESG